MKNSLFAMVALAQVVQIKARADEVMPTIPRRIERTQPDDTALQVTSERQREMDAIEKELKEKRRALEAGQPPATQNAPESVPGATALSEIEIAKLGKLEELPEAPGVLKQGNTKNLSARKSKKGKSEPQIFTNSFQPQSFQIGTPLQVFSVSKRFESELNSFTVLPTGSHVKARVVSGVEANSREPYPVLLQLDYAFSGPNKSRIDLNQCFMIAKARANMSTERVMMETSELSCVREDGEHFKREAKGFVAGSDNTFGATGTYISKQGQVLLAAVLASIAKNAGQAIADAQKTTSIVGGDKAATAANVTGSNAAFVGGSALVDGAGMVAQWYLEQAKELLPSIGVGSGQDVFVVMLDTVKIPTLKNEE